MVNVLNSERFFVFLFFGVFLQVLKRGNHLALQTNALQKFNLDNLLQQPLHVSSV